MSDNQDTGVPFPSEGYDPDKYDPNDPSTWPDNVLPGTPGSQSSEDQTYTPGMEDFDGDRATENQTQEQLNKESQFKFQSDDFEPGEKVGDSRAVRLIFTRLGQLGLDRLRGTSKGEWNTAKAELARKIIAMIPDDLQTEDMLKNGDLRPMFNAVAFSDGEAKRTSPDEKTEVQGMQFSDLERAIATESLVAAQDQVKEQIEEQWYSSMNYATLSPEEQEQVTTFVDNYVNEWRGGEVNRIEEVTGRLQKNSVSNKWEVVNDDGSATEEGENEVLTNALDDGLFSVDLEETQSLTRFMTSTDIQQLVQSGELTLDDLNAMDTEPDGARPAVDGQEIEGQSRVQWQGGQSMERMLRGRDDPRAATTGVLSAKGEEDTRWADKEAYSIREVRRMHYDMNQAEKIALTEKMKKAGLFDLVGAEPTIPGDNTDPAFVAAWEQLIKMSVAQGKPMNDLLTERTSAFEQMQEAALSTKLTDPARLRINGNGYARDVIGRHLTDDEQTRMIEFMHELERENAKVEAGLTSDDPETQLDEGVVADIDARMQEWMRDGSDELAVEAGAKDMADQYEVFTNMLAGPGRGVGR